VVVASKEVREKKRTRGGNHVQVGRQRLTTETVEGSALALEGVDNVERGDGLALGVLGVGNSVTDHTLEEGLEDTTGLLVDHCRGSVTRNWDEKSEVSLLAEIRLTPPRRARRRIAGLVIPWMLSRKILR